MYFHLHPPAPLNVYRALADSLLHDGSLSVAGHLTTQFEPLYPLFLATARFVVREPTLVDLLQIAVASFGAVLLARLTLTLTRDSRAAIVAALLYAIDPLLVREAVGHSESALFTTLLIAFTNAAVSAQPPIGFAVAGAWLGLALLTRTTALPLLLLTPAWFIVRGRPRPAAALGLAALVVVLPLPLRNHAINGAWWPTRSGVNLFIGNSPRTAELLPRDDLDGLQVDADRVVHERVPNVDTLPATTAERVVDATLTREAIAFMTADPLRTIRQKILNAGYVFSPWIIPYRQDGQSRPFVDVAAYAMFSTLMTIGAIAGVYLRRRRLNDDSVLWWVLLTVVVVNIIYVPATRYRAPIEFVLAFYTAAALAGKCALSGVRLASAVAAAASLALRHGSEVAVHDQLRRTIRPLLRFARRVCCPFHSGDSSRLRKNT